MKKRATTNGHNGRARSKKKGAKFRIRITGHGTKPANAFKFNPLNYRKHGEVQREALRQVLGDVGWVQNVIENVRTGNLIDGHARIEEALRDGPRTPVPYVKVDLSPAEEKAVLAFLDPITGLAEIDQETLDQLVEQTVSELPGLEDLLKSLHYNLGAADPEQLNTQDEWVGMPEFEHMQAPRKLIINFADDKARNAFFKKYPAIKVLKRETVTWITWYPYRDRDDRTSVKYEAQE